SLERDEEHDLFALGTNNGTHYSRTIVVCAGIGAFEPKKLDIDGIERFENGRGVHYFAKRIEDFRDRDVMIVGGGDSAVDWATTLLPIARSIALVHRSKFRAHEHQVQALLDSTARVNFPDWAVKAVHGNDRLESITIHH